MEPPQLQQLVPALSPFSKEMHLGVVGACIPLPLGGGCQGPAKVTGAAEGTAAVDASICLTATDVVSGATSGKLPKSRCPDASLQCQGK